jgi:hypothetical protein
MGWLISGEKKVFWQRVDCLQYAHWITQHTRFLCKTWHKRLWKILLKSFSTPNVFSSSSSSVAETFDAILLNVYKVNYWKLIENMKKWMFVLILIFQNIGIGTISVFDVDLCNMKWLCYFTHRIYIYIFVFTPKNSSVVNHGCSVLSGTSRIKFTTSREGKSF